MRHKPQIYVFCAYAVAYVAVCENVHHSFHIQDVELRHDQIVPEMKANEVQVKSCMNDAAQLEVGLDFDDEVVLLGVPRVLVPHSKIAISFKKEPDVAQVVDCVELGIVEC